MEKEKDKKSDQKNNKTEEDNTKKKESSPEEKIKDLEDKLARAYAEMENQRRRFEKEKEDAFEYGGFSFAREALNLIDNLERSKISLESDNDLKDTEALKKILEHLNIINKDMVSILKKNNIEPIKSINEKLNPNIHQDIMEIEENNKEYFYPGGIKLNSQSLLLKNGNELPLQVGMSLQANIKLRKVSYLRLLLGSFRDKTESLKSI